MSRTFDSVHGALSIRGLEISSQFADYEGQLDFIVHLNALRPLNSSLARKDNR